MSIVRRCYLALLAGTLVGLVVTVFAVGSESSPVIAQHTTPGDGYAVFVKPLSPPTDCDPPKVNFPAHNLEFSGSGSPVTTVNGDVRSTGSIYAGSVVVNGNTTFGCQIGPISACHTVCDPAIKVAVPSDYPVPLSAADFPCGTNQPNVYNMSSGTLATAQDQNGIVHYHAPVGSARGTLDSGIYCVSAAVTIPIRICVQATGGPLNTCADLLVPGEGVTIVAQGANSFVRTGSGSACTGAGGCTNLFAYASNVLVYTDASGGGANGSAILLTGGNNGLRSYYSGIIAAPNGMISGAGLATYYGGWEANAVKITGGGIIINADGSLPASARLTVEKDFVPNDFSPVDITVTCTSGTATPSSGIASESSPFTTFITGFDEGATCTATEATPAGYTPNESDCANVPISVSGSSGCTITNVIITPTPGDGDGDGVTDDVDNCVSTANPDQADAEPDGVGDVCDNCPNWPNPSQSLPDWPIPTGDADCDGFPDTANASGKARETYIGTDPSVACALTTAPNDEVDRMPPDFNDDRAINGQDTGKFGGPFGSYNKLVSSGPFGPPGQELPGERFDFNGDGAINGQDTGKYQAYYNKLCTISGP